MRADTQTQKKARREKLRPVPPGIESEKRRADRRGLDPGTYLFAPPAIGLAQVPYSNNFLCESCASGDTGSSCAQQAVEFFKTDTLHDDDFAVCSPRARGAGNNPAVRRDGERCFHPPCSWHQLPIVEGCTVAVCDKRVLPCEALIIFDVCQTTKVL